MFRWGHGVSQEELEAGAVSSLINLARKLELSRIQCSEQAENSLVMSDCHFPCRTNRGFANKSDHRGTGTNLPSQLPKSRSRWKVAGFHSSVRPQQSGDSFTLLTSAEMTEGRS
ncbi:hypothetical protein RBWH47_03549 [Rhodopirellula baltica WH47]|uniref:Uncharacterized protein n=1 Tax=Rhodopirellula baltica WH47 TaxID=991778 RepID=F2AS85_RHOBT|nr:hypothetical protein RBWH47_03549 [Rhodopirellula baltica WH47]